MFIRANSIRQLLQTMIPPMVLTVLLTEIIQTTAVLKNQQMIIKENGESNLATKQKIMKAKKIAKHLADLCEKNEFETAQKEFYAEDVVSIEPQATEDYAKETKGKENVLAKIRKFNDSVETFHNTKVSDPIVAGNSFAFTLFMDLKMKGRERMEMEEICVYEVKDGKIISEQFFM